MRAIIIVMLCVQAGIFLSICYALVFARHSGARPRPLWPSLAIGLVIVASTSWQIADKHLGEKGVDILQFGAPFLLGMGVMTILLLIRQRRNLDTVD
jgi:hypothetical protein